MTPLPVTEQPNDLTAEIDTAEPLEIVAMLKACDAQVFAGFGTEPGLLDEKCVSAAARATVRAAEVARRPDGLVVLAGAGTSGRLAHFISRETNRHLREVGSRECARYLIAGGEAALIQAQERAEDNPRAAVEDLAGLLPKGVKKALYIGISCGLSAPYVAAQVDWIARETRHYGAALGFNNAAAARDTPVEGWDKTFASVLRNCETVSRVQLLNPVIGPEAIMGSTRLKGGTATKIIIEAILAVALDLAREPEESEERHLPAVKKRLREHYGRFLDSMEAAYAQPEGLAAIVRAAGSALRSGGHIYYIGRGTAGALGILDASECPPTFGAEPDDVRGFQRSGWDELLDEDRDLSGLGRNYRVHHDDFERDVLPTIGRGDLVVAIAIGEFGSNTLRLVSEAAVERPHIAGILVTDRPPADVVPPDFPGEVLLLPLAALGLRGGGTNLAELTLKLCLNAITTGAHVMAGKVYRNRMIDLRISNSKLYERAIRTIAELSGATPDAARLALHRAALRTDKLTPEEAAAAPSTIIRAASDRSRVVPCALVMAVAGVGHDDARTMLSADPVVRRVIEGALASRSDRSS